MSTRYNISPDIWGPKIWYTWHIIAEGYPENPSENDKKNYKNFYIYTSKVLPCDLCREDSTRRLSKVNWNQILKSRKTLLQWTQDYHNEINKKLDKPLNKDKNFKEKLKKLTLTDYNLEYIICTILVIIILGLLIRKII